ncbi:hypothetical protein V8G54_005015 [Vigna mungo]|uniref:Uncharacterized protein n=1 Tax=Vigna mungo TaxID=3915 RepID=A0AAQ3PCQ4_VIGMU
MNGRNSRWVYPDILITIHAQLESDESCGENNRRAYTCVWSGKTHRQWFCKAVGPQQVHKPLSGWSNHAVGHWYQQNVFGLTEAEDVLLEHALEGEDPATNS